MKEAALELINAMQAYWAANPDHVADTESDPLLKRFSDALDALKKLVDAEQEAN